MKKFTCYASLALILALSTNFAKAQRADSLTVEKVTRNLFKVNLTSLALNNYSFTYERAIGKKTALGLGFRYMPESGLPFKTAIINQLDQETGEQLDLFRMGNRAFTGEIKFYMGKGVFRGFYIAPFVRHATYTAKMPFDFDVPDETGNYTTETIPLSGELTALTGGLLFGAQWKLSKRIYLDWSMLGPQYGSSKGGLKATKSLNADEQDALREELKELENSDIPMLKITTDVNASGATVDFTGPWAGIRASIGLGFRF